MAKPNKRHDRASEVLGPGAADPERLRARLELRRSSAGARHTPAPRKGSRTTRRQQAIKDSRREY